MNFLKLSKNKLDLEAITDMVVHESCGAVSIFVGTTRDNFDDKQVVSLKYEAYDAMALKVLNKICDEIRNKWNEIKHIAIYHRLGDVPVKESSVIIAISSPHRQDSLEAVQFAIDELKKTVPIWKKEVYGGECEGQTNQNTSLPRKRMKRSNAPISFDTCCPIKNEIVVSKDLLQIRANELELKRRIACFIDRKRDEINSNNIQDFIASRDATDDEMTCARVNSSVCWVKGSKSHLKVHRVKNESGPLTINYTNALNKLMQNNSPTKIKSDPDAPLPAAAALTKIPSSIDERIVNAEFFLNIPTAVKKTIFERLKDIEHRILYLESLSPEYNHFLYKSAHGAAVANNSTAKIEIKKEKKKVYTAEELDDLIKKIETQK